MLVVVVRRALDPSYATQNFFLYLFDLAAQRCLALAGGRDVVVDNFVDMHIIQKMNLHARSQFLANENTLSYAPRAHKPTHLNSCVCVSMAY